MITEAFVLTCDHCGTHQAYDARYFLPQQALAEASQRRLWTVYGERTHCADCPPLCGRCGCILLSDDCSWCHGQG